MNRKDPKLCWMQFYGSDWRADPCLKLCSLAARGLWMEMLCLMMSSAKHGFLCHPNSSEPLMTADLAKLTGFSELEISPLLKELEGNGVFSRDETTTIYSRRMIRDAERRHKKASNSRNYRRRARSSSSGTFNDVITESPVCSQSRVKETKDQRLEAEDQSPETYEPISLEQEPNRSLSRSINSSEEHDHATGKVYKLHKLFGAKAGNSHTTSSVCDLDTLIKKGTSIGLEESFCREEFLKLSGNGWCDSHGKPIAELDAYLRGIARNQGVQFSK
jgi:hypothetical protein